MYAPCTEFRFCNENDLILSIELISCRETQNKPLIIIVRSRKRLQTTFRYGAAKSRAELSLVNGTDFFIGPSRPKFDCLDFFHDVLLSFKDATPNSKHWPPSSSRYSWIPGLRSGID